MFSNYAGDIRLPDGQPWYNSFIVEIFGSFFISFFFHAQVDPATSVSSNRQIFAALVSGVQVFMMTGIAMLGSAYGSGLNPAIALGITVAVACDGGLRSHYFQWVFFVGPIVGAVIGSFFYYALYKKHVLMHLNRYKTSDESE